MKAAKISIAVDPHILPVGILSPRILNSDIIFALVAER
jgi:hypothetical protein